MTQIDAGPMPTGRTATQTNSCVLRSHGRGGQAEGDAAMEGGKPRFGDHWRSILSGGGNPGEKASADPPSGEDGAADDKPRSAHLAAQLRLPVQPFDRVGEAPSVGEAPASSIEAAQAGSQLDISDALAALQGTAGAQDRSGSDGDSLHRTQRGDGDAFREHSQPGETAAHPAAEPRVAVVGVPAPGAGEIAPHATRDTTLASAQAALPDRTARGAAHPAKAPGAAGAEPDLHLSTRGEAGTPALKATVVHQATHFAPALGAVNIQAFSGAIAELVGDLRQGPGRAAPDPALQQPGARPTGPVKTLTIQLTPISLGKVTVEMRMIGGAMQVDIQVADPKALELVRADKDLIMNLVRKTGIVPDTITIQTVDAASASKQNQAGQNAAGQGGNGSAFEREASRDGSGGRGPRDDHDQERISHDDRSIDHSHLRGDIYL